MCRQGGRVAGWQVVKTECSMSREQNLRFINPPATCGSARNVYLLVPKLLREDGNSSVDNMLGQLSPFWNPIAATYHLVPYPPAAHTNRMNEPSNYRLTIYRSGNTIQNCFARLPALEGLSAPLLFKLRDLGPVRLGEPPSILSRLFPRVSETDTKSRLT